tara:strand:+ start:290 stop:409 length:120 start_codon:yes stop_codon:yes gene_type:complete
VVLIIATVVNAEDAQKKEINVIVRKQRKGKRRKEKRKER